MHPARGVAEPARAPGHPTQIAFPTMGCVRLAPLAAPRFWTHCVTRAYANSRTQTSDETENFVAERETRSGTGPVDSAPFGVGCAALNLVAATGGVNENPGYNCSLRRPRDGVAGAGRCTCHSHDAGQRGRRTRLLWPGQSHRRVSLQGIEGIAPWQGRPCPGGRDTHFGL